jgi:ketosteroid isomerase-like protein
MTLSESSFAPVNHTRRRDMRIIIRLLALCAILFVAQSKVAFSGIEEDLNQLEEKRYAALIAGDWAALDALLADDFFYNQASGATVTKAAFVEYMKGGEAKVRKAVREDTKIRLYGDTALVTGRTHIDVTLKGEDKVLHVRYLHVWLRKNDAWKLEARQATYIPDKK